MAPELPPEIWSQIASFIPDADLCKLYSVNRYFYELVMNVKYQELRIYHFTNATVSKLDCARAPSLAKRIRYLTIESSAFHSLIPGARYGLFWKNALRPLISSITRPRKMDPHALTSKPFHTVYRTLLDVAKHMENIQYFHIGMYPRHMVALYLDYVRQLWPPLSGRVSSLSLDVHGEDLNSISEIFPDLSRLEHLSIHIHFDPGPQEALVSTNLTNFLNRVAGTLGCLSLNLSSTSIITGFHYLFENLDHFSNLKQMNLESLFSGIAGTGTARFLNSHGDGITTLSFTPYTSGNSWITPLSALQLPALQNLDLSFQYVNIIQFPQFWSGTLSFPVLNTLTLSRVFPTHDLVLIGDALRRSGISEQLRHLRLYIRLLDGYIIDALARSFPCLRTLYLNATFLCREALPWDMEQISDEMEVRRYPDWSLYDLTITADSSSVSTQALYAAMEIVAKSVPSIQSFCGNGCMDIPVDP